MIDRRSNGVCEVREELRLMTVAMEAAQCGSARSGFNLSFRVFG